MANPTGSMFPSDNGIYRIRKCGIAFDDRTGSPSFRLDLARPDGIVVQAWLSAEDAGKLAEMACDGTRPPGYLHEVLEGACVSLHFDASGRADAIGDPFGISKIGI